jgi:transposase-like protein
MKKQRKHYTPEEKVAILRRHLLENEPISKLCDELGLQPTVFYRWQKEFFENGAAAFEQKARPNHSADQERIAYLEKKIQTKDEVLADLMAEHVALKKTLGELSPGSGFRTIRGTRSWISSGAGRRRPRSAPGVSLCGSTSPPASFTTGGNATAR